MENPLQILYVRLWYMRTVLWQTKCSMQVKAPQRFGEPSFSVKLAL